MEVRSQRASISNFKDYYSVGSVSNPPTRESLLKLLELLDANGSAIREKIHFAGNGLPELESHFEGERTRFVEEDCPIRN